MFLFSEELWTFLCLSWFFAAISCIIFVSWVIRNFRRISIHQIFISFFNEPSAIIPLSLSYLISSLFLSVFVIKTFNNEKVNNQSSNLDISFVVITDIITFLPFAISLLTFLYKSWIFRIEVKGFLSPLFLFLGIPFFWIWANTWGRFENYLQRKDNSEKLRFFEKSIFISKIIKTLTTSIALASTVMAFSKNNENSDWITYCTNRIGIVGATVNIATNATSDFFLDVQKKKLEREIKESIRNTRLLEIDNISREPIGMANLLPRNRGNLRLRRINSSQ